MTLPLALTPVHEPAVYRPFALVAFAVALVIGIPLGVRMLAWLYLGAPAVEAESIWLHAHLQLLGFFGTLIMGVAQHLLPRFTGRPVVPSTLIARCLGLHVAGLGLRVLGVGIGQSRLILVAALVQAGVFLLFAGWVWRSLDPPPLAPLRRQLTAATGWLAAGCLLEAALRWRAWHLALDGPSPPGLRVVALMILFGGIIGWVLGVLLRAGPMFVRGWAVPPRVARRTAWPLALGVAIAASGELGDWPGLAGPALARTGELVALVGAASVIGLGGALHRVRSAPPVIGRSAEESRIFRLAAASLSAAVVGTAGAAGLAWSGADARLPTDAARHLLTVGFLTGVVVAMAFRLIPVLEGRGLPWPRLRRAAFWALLAGVLLRTAEVLVGIGLPALAPWIPLSGVLVWIAVACVAINLLGATRGSARGAGGAGGAGRIVGEA